MSDALAMRNASNSPEDKTDGALARVVKLVPGEGLLVYNSGYSLIDPADFTLQWAWVAICLIMTLGLRWKYMEDPSGTTRQWISCVAFVIYVYASGGPFKSIPELWKPTAGMLAALAWPVFAGIMYDGPKIPKT